MLERIQTKPFKRAELAAANWFGRVPARRRLVKAEQALGELETSGAGSPTG